MTSPRIKLTPPNHSEIMRRRHHHFHPEPNKANGSPDSHRSGRRRPRRRDTDDFSERRQDDVASSVHRRDEAPRRANPSNSNSYPLSSSPASSSNASDPTSTTPAASPLFRLLNRRLWNRAVSHLDSHPVDARIWIASDSVEAKWRNLPLHLACTMGPGDDSSAMAGMDGPSPGLVERLIECYPLALRKRNMEGHLPIHLACDTLSFLHSGNETEAILSTLVRNFPQSLLMKDGRGVRPADILEGRGVRAEDNWRGGSILRYMKQKMGELENGNWSYHVGDCADEERERERDLEYSFSALEEDRGAGGLEMLSSLMCPQHQQQHQQQQQQEEQIHDPRRRRQRPAATLMHRGDSETVSLLGTRYSDEERTDGSASHDTMDFGGPTERSRPAKIRALHVQTSDNAVDPDGHADHRGDDIVSDSPTERQRGRRTETVRRDGNRNCLAVQTFSVDTRSHRPDTWERSKADGYSSDPLDFHSPNQSRNEMQLGPKNRRHDRGLRQQHLIIGINRKDDSPSTLHSPDEGSFDHFYNPIPVVTPANHDSTSYTPKSNQERSHKSKSTNSRKRANKRNSKDSDPFHHLEQQLHTMKTEHRSLCDLLDSKSHTESQLRSGLSKLEEAHAKLQKEYSLLKSSRSELVEGLKDKDRRLDDGEHEIQVLKTKEKAVSSELALMIRKEEEQQNKFKELQQQLNEEKEARIAIEKELEGQKIEVSKLQEAKNRMAQSNDDLSKQLTCIESEKQSLIRDAAALKDEIAQKDKRLAEAKTKESSLCEQLIVKISALETTEQKSSETQTLLHREQEKNRTLEHQLLVGRGKADRNEMLQNMLEEEQVRCRELEHQLLLLRKAAASADEGSSLRRERQVAELSIASTEEVANLKTDQSGDPSDELALSADESMELISPVISDASNIQREFVERSQHLFHKTTLTTRLIERIPHLSGSENYSFRSTLQTLEGIITTHIDLIGVFDNAIDAEERCISKLSSLLNLSRDQLASLEKSPSSSTAANGFAIPSIPKAASNKKKQYTKLATATRNHIKKIENLHQMALGLHPIQSKGSSAGTAATSVDHRHVGVANEMRLIFRRAMANLFLDTKHLGVVANVLMKLAGGGDILGDGL